MKKLLFIAIILGFNVLLLEGLLRVYLAVRYETPLVVFKKFGYDRHPLLGFELMPNVKDQKFPSIETKFSSNSKGLRGEGELGPKKKNEVRVGIMGGSSAFGFGASDDEHTLSHFLELELKKLDPSKDWNVINAANPAYNSFQVYSRLQLRMVELDPDAMIFYMGWNDMYLCHPHLFGRNKVMKQDQMYQLDSWQNFITVFNENNYPIPGTNSFAITLFSKRVYMKLFPKKTVFDQVVNAGGESTTETSTPKDKPINNEFGVPLNYTIDEKDFHQVTEMLYDNLTSIAGVCKAHGMTTIFSSLTSDVDLFSHDRKKLNQTIQAVCEKQQVTFIDSDTYVIDQKLKGINNAVDKYHLTDHGNETLAKYWAPIVLKQVSQR